MLTRRRCGACLIWCLRCLRCWSHVRPAVLVLALGGNDADIDWRRFIVSGGERVRSNTPLDRYLVSLASIFAIASARGVRTVLVEVMGSQMTPRGVHLSEIAAKDLWDYSAVGRSAACGREIVRMYREKAAEVARAHGVLIAPVGSSMDASTANRRSGPMARTSTTTGTRSWRTCWRRASRACFLRLFRECCDDCSILSRVRVMPSVGLTFARMTIEAEVLCRIQALSTRAFRNPTARG